MPRIIAAIQAPLPLRSIQVSQIYTHPPFVEVCVASGARVVIMASLFDVNNVYIKYLEEFLSFCNRVCKSFLHFLTESGNSPPTEISHLLRRAAEYMNGCASSRIDLLIIEQRLVKKCHDLGQMPHGAHAANGKSCDGTYACGIGFAQWLASQKRRQIEIDPPRTSRQK